MIKIMRALSDNKLLLSVIVICLSSLYFIGSIYVEINTLARHDLINVTITDYSVYRFGTSISFNYTKNGDLYEKTNYLFLPSYSITRNSVEKAYEGKYIVILKKVIVIDLITHIVLLIPFLLVLTILAYGKYKIWKQSAKYLLKKELKVKISKRNN